MQKETAVRAIIIGIVITVIGGIILAVVNDLLFTKPDPIKSPEEVQSDPIIQIDYGRSGRFLILGPNPGGVWASPALEQKFMWHSFDLSITNNCGKKIHITPSNFRLSLSRSSEFDQANVYLPTTEGMEFQTRRLKSAILSPGETITGTLTFRVKDKQDDESNRMHDILKYAGTFECEVSYNGQR